MHVNNQQYDILVVEDNMGDFVLITDYLEEQLAGSAISHAKDYQETIEFLNTNSKFDVIFLDLSLPDKSGEELIISVLKVSKKIPIIVLTGYSDINFTIKSIALGVSDYLVKDELNALVLYKSLIYNIERKKSLIELQQSEKRYIDLFQFSPQPMWVYRLDDLKFLQVNKAAVNHYGYTEKEFKKMTIADILPKTAINSEDNKVIEKKFTKYNKHITKEGRLIDVFAQSNSFNLNDEKCKIVIINDITEDIQVEKRIMREIIKAQEDERFEIGAELHDNVCQILAASQFDIEILKLSIDASKISYLNHFNECVNMALTEIRNLSHRLTPSFIHEMNIEESFYKLFQTFGLDKKYSIYLKVDEEFNREDFLSIDLKLNFFRILQEQIRNIIKHAKADHIIVKLMLIQNQICMEITDNGVGFDEKKLDAGIGFSNMKKRVEIFSGDFSVHSTIGQGCTIFAKLPYCYTIS
jgi:PAS domain S-box-containing protein